ncbi:uncharacterized protein [Clytia hemisphaerica]|uniref:Uncharacterized protein n=1 Tax=Clytia hemisphaerica TaxID=252671 RepID=A0A7M5UQ29_9CNID
MLHLQRRFVTSRTTCIPSLKKTFTKTLSTRTEFTHRTEENVIRGNKSLEYPVEDCFTFFSKRFEQFGERVAMVDGVTGTELTFSQLVQNSRKLGSYFHEKNFKLRDRVSIFLPTCTKYSYSMLGAFANGMAVTTIHPAFTAHEMHNQIKTSTPKVVITNAHLLDTARQASENSSIETMICLDDTSISDSGVVNMSDILQNGDENFSTDLSAINPEKDIAFILYSSGTTGLPKGVIISHFSMINCLLQVREFFGENMPDNVLAAIPVYHMYGMVLFLFVNPYHGNRVYTLPKFDPVQFLSSIQNYKIGRICIAPPILLFLTKSPLVDQYDMSSLKSIIVGAAPVDEQLSHAFNERFPWITLQQCYGMTEAGFATLQANDASFNSAGSVGQILADGECKIVSLTTGEFLGPYEQGEVYLRGAQQMLGYLNNEKATTETILEDGWLRSGDLGYYDDENNLFVIDRLKELIKYKGFQVAPAELEDLLISHENIVDSCVIGVPCERAGEVPRAYIVKKPGSDLTEDEVKDFVGERFSDHKHLRGGVQFVEQLPKSASGKLLRRVLRDQYLEERE